MNDPFENTAPLDLAEDPLVQKPKEFVKGPNTCAKCRKVLMPDWNRKLCEDCA